MAADDPHAMTYLPPTYSTRHTLVNSNDRNLSLEFFVYEDKVGIMLEDSHPTRPYMKYSCVVNRGSVFCEDMLVISTCKPIEMMEIGVARTVWESLVSDHGWVHLCV